MLPGPVIERGGPMDELEAWGCGWLGWRKVRGGWGGRGEGRKEVEPEGEGNAKGDDISSGLRNRS